LAGRAELKELGAQFAAQALVVNDHRAHAKERGNVFEVQVDTRRKGCGPVRMRSRLSAKPTTRLWDALGQDRSTELELLFVQREDSLEIMGVPSIEPLFGEGGKRLVRCCSNGFIHALCALTFDMRGMWKQAQLAGTRPLDGRVRGLH